MVMTQVGERFVITDYVVSKVALSDEANLDTDSDIKKRLVSLGIKSEVTEKVQSEILETLNNLYTAGTERKIKDLENVFNSNTELLSSLDKNYLVNKLQSYLTVFGGNVPSKYSGAVSEWLGGTDAQAELVVTELVDYESRGVGIITEVYYLMSKYNDTWVVDEKEILASKNIQGGELGEARNSIGSGKSVQIKDPDNELITKKVGNNDAEDGKDLDFTIDDEGKVQTKDKNSDKEEASSEVVEE